jgi:hypothetical protein
MTAVGYRYYLPGFMKLSLQNPEMYDLPAYIAEVLTPPAGSEHRRATWLRDYKNPFRPEQQQVIRDFLLWVNGRFEGGNWWEAAGRALSAGWDGRKGHSGPAS